MTNQLDAVLGALGGDNVQGGLADLIQSQGGVGGLLQQFQASGLDDAAQSWVSTGPNQFLSADQISSVLGSGPVADFARRLGVEPAQAAAVIAMILPLVISHLTPNGRAEEADGNLGGLPGGLGDVLGSVLGGGQQGGAGGLPGGLGDILGGALGGALGGNRAGGSAGGLPGGLGDLLGGILGGRRR